MNRIYEVDEGRPVWKLFLVMLLVSIVLLVLVAAMGLLLVVAGPLAETVGDSSGWDA
jgi:membrane protein